MHQALGSSLLEGGAEASMVCLSYLFGWCDSVTVSLPVVLTISQPLTLSASLCALCFLLAGQAP